jgi:hypothetical protein
MARQRLWLWLKGNDPTGTGSAASSSSEQGATAALWQRFGGSPHIPEQDWQFGAGGSDGCHPGIAVNASLRVADDSNWHGKR